MATNDPVILSFSNTHSCSFWNRSVWLELAESATRRVVLLQLLSIHDEAVSVTNLGVMLLWFILHARAYANCWRSCLYYCHPLRPAHTPTVAVRVQTCWTFKASADQRWHFSQSRKCSKVTEGRHVLHRDIWGRIQTHTLACWYFYPRRNLRYAVATHRQTQVWTFVRLPAHTRAWSMNPV